MSNRDCTRILCAACFLILFLSDPVQVSTAQNQADSNAIVGLWGSEQTFGPLVRGELIIDARVDGWRASIAGYEVPVDQTKSEIYFALPGEAGRFRGHLSTNGQQIFGHWIQLAGVAFYSYSYASPVVLSELAPRAFGSGPRFRRTAAR